ncbi:MAG: hypothetical protein LBN25_00360 [Christensenellaceae bacterium]|jgi:hypothetical protein|nr:hypothetical protein [Christensenellaceae bacterium]
MLSALEYSTIAIIVEAAVALIVILAFVLGVKKGFLKVSRGILATLAVVAIAAISVGSIQTLLNKNVKLKDGGNEVSVTAYFVSKAKLDELSNKVLKFSNPNITLYYLTSDTNVLDGDGNRITGVVYADQAENVWSISKLSDGDRIKEMSINYIIKPAAVKYFTNNISGRGTLIRFFSLEIANYIYIAALFIVLCIVYRIIVSLLYFILKLLIQRMYLMHFFNGVLGGALIAVLAFVVLIIVSLLLQIVADILKMPEITAVLKETKVIQPILDFITSQKEYATVNDVLKNIPGVGGSTTSELISIIKR